MSQLYTWLLDHPRGGHRLAYGHDVSLVVSRYNVIYKLWSRMFCNRYKKSSFFTNHCRLTRYRGVAVTTFCKHWFKASRPVHRGQLYLAIIRLCLYGVGPSSRAGNVYLRCLLIRQDTWIEPWGNWWYIIANYKV